MNRFLSNPNARVYVLLAAISVVAGAWHVGEAVYNRMVLLPIKQAPRTDRNAIPISAKTFYSVWVKQAAAAPVQQANANTELDSLFLNKVEPKPDLLVVAEPDYGQLFREMVNVDGVSKAGAFINGRYYKVGEPMSELNFSGPVPVIDSIDHQGINFRIGKTKVAFQTKGG